MLALAAALVAGAAAATEPVAKPMHIMSLNVCTDALLLQLVPPERIASVTYLSRSRSESLLWAQAARVPVNHGLAEEVLAEHPDLVLAGTYTTPAARALLEQLHMPLLEVPPAENFAQIRQVTRLVAHAVGESERGEQLLERMDATLHQLSLTRPKRALRVVSWDGAGAVPGQGTLFNAILRAAGGINVAALPGSRSTYWGIERVLLAHPDLLAYGSASVDTPSLHAAALQHPLILALYARRRVVYPDLLYSCGLPQSADAARELRAQLLEAMRAPPPVP